MKLKPRNNSSQYPEITRTCWGYWLVCCYTVDGFPIPVFVAPQRWMCQAFLFCGG
jgi:hypothetical protein